MIRLGSRLARRFTTSDVIVDFNRTIRIEPATSDSTLKHHLAHFRGAETDTPSNANTTGCSVSFEPFVACHGQTSRQHANPGHARDSSFRHH